MGWAQEQRASYPFSLGLKEGAHLVDVTFYRGAEVIAPALSAEHTKGALAPHEMSYHFVRYAHYVAYEPARFTQVYDWMRSWGLASL